MIALSEKVAMEVDMLKAEKKERAIAAITNAVNRDMVSAEDVLDFLRKALRKAELKGVRRRRIGPAPHM